MKNGLIHNIYRFYDRHAENLVGTKLDQTDGSLIKTRALLILWTCTTIVMWLYVLYCFLAFKLTSPVPWGGLIFSIIHTFSPLVLRWSQSFTIAGLNISLSGLGFQTLFCLYTGGVYSPAAIWLTFHPVILGFFGSTGWILFSVALNFLIVVLMYAIGSAGLLPADELPALFRDGMIISSYVGLDVLVAIFTVTAIKINHQKNSELNKSKDMTENLVRVLCHDINNPLTIIRVASKHLSPVNQSPLTPQFAEKIQRAGNDIQKITDSVNTWISHKDGKVKLKQQKISVQDIIDHLEFAFEDKLKDKDLTMCFEVDDYEHQVLGDRTAVFYQVFNNLISNAIKFSYERSRIDLRFHADQNLVHIEVRDYGIGIKDEVIDKVFSAYDFTTSRGTKNEKGTGFGLPIAATVVEKMDGKIKIENMGKVSAGEQGTRVVVSLPQVY